MKKYTKSLNIEYIMKSEESLREFLHSVIEISWNHMIPIFSTMLLVLNENPWYIIGIIIPLFFQIKLNNEDD